jgi:tRNA(Ile)-lysidine synthase TilS/MesJ
MNSARKYRRHVYRELAEWLSERSPERKQRIRFAFGHTDDYFIIGDATAVYHFRTIEKLAICREVLIKISDVSKAQNNKEILEILKPFKLSEIDDMISKPMKL